MAAVARTGFDGREKLKFLFSYYARNVKIESGFLAFQKSNYVQLV